MITLNSERKSKNTLYCIKFHIHTMGLNSDYIRENLTEIGKKEGLTLLRELIGSSGNSNVQRKALESFEAIENGKNFTFFEQLFLSDEDIVIRLMVGNYKKL